MTPTNPITEARDHYFTLKVFVPSKVTCTEDRIRWYFDHAIRGYYKQFALETDPIRGMLDCSVTVEKTPLKAETQAAEIERLKAEVADLTKQREDQHTMTNRWGYNAQRARDDVRTLLRIDDEMEYGKNSQKNLDALEEIRSRYAKDGDEYRRPELLDELAILKAKLAKAEEKNARLRSAVEEGIITLDRGKKQSAAMAEMYEALSFHSERVEASRPFNFAEETVEEARQRWTERRAAQFTKEREGG